MSELFGVPVTTLAVVLAATLAVALGAVSALAARNRVFLRLGLRNARRRPGRSALIVTGLMLGTAIITAALATGDTMSHTIRGQATAALGRTDVVVAAQGVSTALGTGAGGTAIRSFPEVHVYPVSAAGGDLVAGVTPVIVESIAVQDVTTRQTESRVTLFASDPARLRPFAPLSLTGLQRGEVLLNTKAADKLGARAGDRLHIFYGVDRWTVRVKSIVPYSGAATDGAAVLMPLRAAQSILGWPGSINAIFVANKGGVAQTDQVIARLTPALVPLGLEADNTKQDALEAADTAGATFMSMFTTFGSFSIAAGILLIFLIFVMLAAERRGELGIARAVGTRRGHLVQLFLYEGAAYDLVAALVGAVIGVAVAYGMVIVLASAFAATSDLDITYAVEPASVVLAYVIGVLLTFAVVAFSAWRVSRMNISTAIRNLPEPPHVRSRRRRLVLPAVGIVLGALLVFTGVSGENAVPLGLGVSVIVLSLVPLAHAAGVPDRLSHTVAGLLLIAWFVFPTDRWTLGDTAKVDFSIFVLGGLMIVIGSTWVIMYNADILLGALGATLGRLKGVAPVLRMAMAYPLRSRFRTGVTLAMFTLVVFTLGVGAMTTGSFVKAFDDPKAFGGGFDVRATTSSGTPVLDMRGALDRSRGINSADIRFVSSQSTLPVEVRQLGVPSEEESYVVHGADDTFLRHTTYGLASRANGYRSTADVWRALREHPNLAVVDQLVVPRKANWGAPAANFRLTGFYLEDETFAPVRIRARDAQSGGIVTLTVIGVLSDSSPAFMTGIWTSQHSLNSEFRDRVLPTTHLFALRPGVDPKATAAAIESSFLANGMEADSLPQLLDDAVGANLTFDRLLMGFMGLGLVVGVAALGVITARAVVERRQQIGVLRAIGFSRGMVQASFLIESSFIALTSIFVGTGLALAVAYNVVNESRRTPSWEHMAFAVPWGTLGVVFLVVYAVAVATTLAPAARAARIYPAEALRYQ